MQDDMIVDLYWQRDENAVRETEQKYGRYLFKIANNILADYEDSSESVNDTYLKAWNSMPPHKPAHLASYLGKITRELSIDIYRGRNRKKRKASEYELSLFELSECVSGKDTAQEIVDLHILAEALNSYLLTLTPQARNTFVARYYYMDSIEEISGYYKMSRSKIKSMLYRTRQGLKSYLEKEGFDL